MSDVIIEGLNEIDRESLMERLASELTLIGGEMGCSVSGIAERTGLDSDRLHMIVSGKRKMKWSEYLSIFGLMSRFSAN